MNLSLTPITRALISVSDKTGIIAFAEKLAEKNVEIISTGGTAKALVEAGIPVIEISDFTGFPEMMNGRVKTLHPKVHGGILGLRDAHASTAAEHGIKWIDLVVCNLYPFAATIQKPGVSEDEAIENIDIGGPSMIRSAAKNVGWVGVVVDPSDYEFVKGELETQGGITIETRKRLSAKAFGHTAAYDALISNYFNAEPFPSELTLGYKKFYDLRYGENPHQLACVYQESIPTDQNVLGAIIHQGKQLSYNNINDADGAWFTLREFPEPTCVVVKHANPCGVASDSDITVAFKRAYAADALSAFGGVIALNRPCTAAIAEEIAKVFAEIVLAPSYETKALEVLAPKKNLRVLEMKREAAVHNTQNPRLGGVGVGETFASPDSTTSPTPGLWATPAQAGIVRRPVYKSELKNNSPLEYRFINGGLLVQEQDTKEITLPDLKIVTAKQPSEQELQTMLFAWKVLKHMKSNAILVAKDNTTVGVGVGQVSRVDAVDIALKKAGDRLNGSILASDAFFPFRDSIDKLAGTGITAIIQPGGSVKDKEVIEACNEHGIAMVFTGVRCFKH